MPAIAASTAASPNVSQVEGNTNRSAAAYRSAMSSAGKAPSMCSLSSTPSVAASSSNCSCFGPAPASTRCACGRQASARMSRSWFFCAVSRPTLSRIGCAGGRPKRRRVSVAAVRRRRRIEAVFDQDHRAPITRRIAGELGPGRGAVDDVGGIKSERADQPVHQPQQPRRFARRAGLVNDAQPAAGKPADDADQNRRGRLISDQRIEIAAPDAPRHAQRVNELAIRRQAGARIQIRGFDGEAARREPGFDHAGKFLHAAAFVVVNDLQNTHRRLHSPPVFCCIVRTQLNDTR